MKFEVQIAFGYASVGDIIYRGRTVGGGLYVQGYLRTARRYEQFVIPRECVHVGALETAEDLEYHARRTDPDTSDDEMERHEREATVRERRILEAFYARGRRGYTSREVADVTGIPHVSTSTTITKMVRRHWLSDTTERRGNAIVRVHSGFAG